MPDIAGHHDRHQKRNRHRGNRMGIKYFQKFNIRRNYRNQVSLIPSFQLCRAKPAQRCKHLAADQRKQAKRDVMIARLLGIAQNSAKKRQKSRHNQSGLHADSRIRADRIQNGISTQNRQKRRCEVPRKSHQNRRQHKAGQRTHQNNQFPANCNIRSLFHACAPPFPYCSSSCCAFHNF